jgi:hypothetical protein
MKSEELEEQLNKTYDSRIYKGLAEYIAISKPGLRNWMHLVQGSTLTLTRRE